MSGFGFYMQYLQSLCRRRGWRDPSYECYRDHSGYSCLVLVNGREYQTDLTYESDVLAQENAAMRAFMVCRNFSVNGGMLARNGIVQGLPADESNRDKRRRVRQASSATSASSSSSGSGSGNGSNSHRHHGSKSSHQARRSSNHSSSSSTASFEYA